MNTQATEAADGRLLVIMGYTICVHCRTRPVAPEWTPFCSERCKLLDLGNWMDGRYRVTGETTTVPDEDDPDERPSPESDDGAALAGRRGISRFF